jgi:hypothetical protein
MKIGTWGAVLSVWLIALFGVCFGASAQSRAARAPPASVPTFSTEDITKFFAQRLDKNVQ